MALTLSKSIVDFLSSHPGEKFTAREIAEWVFKTFPQECQEKKNNSQNLKTDTDLIQQLQREIGGGYTRLQKNNPKLKMTEDRPRQYYYSDQSEQAQVVATETTGLSIATGETKVKLKEQDLYPRLASYLWSEFGVYARRIDEKRSGNKQGPSGNHWLHPDLVGMEDLSADWHQEVKDCVHQYSDKRTRLWSFEVKLLINRSNVRECFFQAVSNSSWSNFGYLVVAEIEGQETLKELRMLFSAHGIGLIKLDIENPSESQVLIPARERVEIDWDAVNRLATENKDFLYYVKLVRQFYQTGEARLKDWDLPEEIE